MKIKSINSSKDYTVSDSVFKVPMNDQVVYQCVVAELNNARQGTSSTKNRSLVSGGVKNHLDKKEQVMPVSYTHLTLPTKRIV